MLLSTKGGGKITHAVHECDVWHFFGESMSKGKKNDHVFHNSCLDQILSHYQETFKMNNKPPMNHAILWTDNCSGQYKCRQGFYKIATCGDRHEGVRISHRFAQKYCFKGVWDGAGKVVKAYIRNLEDSLQQRFPDALTCFLKCREPLALPKNRKPWEEWEAKLDPRILDKSEFTVSRRYFGYATDDKGQYEQLGTKYPHVVFTDREHIPTIGQIKGTQSLHSVAGDSSPKQPSRIHGRPDTYKLTVAAMPCACLVCRGEITDQECPFKHIRNEEVLHVREEDEREKLGKKPRNQEHTVIIEQLTEPLCERLGAEQLTITILKKALRERHLPTGGLKHEQMRRLALFFESAEANPGDPPLATDYIRDDDDLCDENEAGNEEGIETDVVL